MMVGLWGGMQLENVSAKPGLDGVQGIRGLSGGSWPGSSALGVIMRAAGEDRGMGCAIPLKLSHERECSRNKPIHCFDCQRSQEGARWREMVEGERSWERRAPGSSWFSSVLPGSLER